MDDRVEGRKKEDKRGWWTSIGVAAVTVGVGILLSATVNPIFDRSVHWDWMAGIAPVLFGLLAFGIRRRWI